MKREEKNVQTRQKIMAAAIQEFGKKGYSESSLNNICGDGGISKGIIYHYFKDKDALFLVCIQACFQALTAFLKDKVRPTDAHMQPDADLQTRMQMDLRRYFDARITFFDRNPLYLKLYCNAVILPPQHLVQAITEVRKEFDALSVSLLTALLEPVKLRGDITMEEVIHTFRAFQDWINTRYQAQTIHQVDLKEHEERCSRTLDILLYGVVEREKQP